MGGSTPGRPDDPERIDPFGLEPERAGGTPAPVGSGGPSAPRVVAAIGAALAALWLVTAIASSGGRPDETTETAEEPAFIEPTPAPSPTPTATPLPTATPTPTPAPGSFFNERVARTIRRQLSSAAPNHSVIYVSADGVGELRLDTGEAPPLRSEVTNLWSFAGGELLRSEAGPVYAVDDADLDLVHIVATNRLAASMSPTMIAFADGEAAANVEIVEVGDVPQWTAVTVPPAVTLRALDTLGIVAVSEDGATSLATADGFEPISDHEVVSAAESAWVELRCRDGEAACDVAVIDRVDGGEHLIPSEFVNPGDDYLVAPDGSAVLITSPDGLGHLHPVDAGGLWWVDRSIVDPTWAPDSSFIAWIDLDGDPALKLMHPERKDWIMVDLDLLGAAVPVERALLVIQHPPERSTG